MVIPTCTCPMKDSHKLVRTYNQCMKPLPIDAPTFRPEYPINALSMALEHWTDSIDDGFYAYGVKSAWWWGLRETPYRPHFGPNAGRGCYLVITLGVWGPMIKDPDGDAAMLVSEYGFLDWLDPRGPLIIRGMNGILLRQLRGFLKKS